jgi:hypothetical protein
LLYEILVAFPGSTLASLEVRVAGLQMPSNLQTFQGIIGRDILDHWEFFYSGLRRRFTIRDKRSIRGWLFS